MARVIERDVKRLHGRKARREMDEHMTELVERFARYLSATHMDRLPRAGYYVQSSNEDDGWAYLEGETDQTQDRRLEQITDDTSFALGVFSEGAGPGR